MRRFLAAFGIASGWICGSVAAFPSEIPVPLIVTGQEWRGGGPCGQEQPVSGGAFAMHQVCSDNDVSVALLSSSVDGKLIITIDGMAARNGADLSGTIDASFSVPETVIAGVSLPTSTMVVALSIEGAISQGTALINGNAGFLYPIASEALRAPQASPGGTGEVRVTNRENLTSQSRAVVMFSPVGGDRLETKIGVSVHYASSVTDVLPNAGTATLTLEVTYLPEAPIGVAIPVGAGFVAALAKWREWQHR